MATINGVNVGWNEANPADTEKVALGASRMRSIKTATRTGVAAEHNFPSTGGAAFGYHVYGAARTYVGTESRVSSSGTDGRLMTTSDTSRLFAVGSGGTVLLGGATVPSFGSVPWTLPQRHYWAEEFGVGVTNSQGTANVTFPNSGFSGVPQIMLSAYGSHATDTRLSVDTIATTLLTATAFRVYSYNVSAGTVGPVNFMWRSAGSRVL